MTLSLISCLKKTQGQDWYWHEMVKKLLCFQRSIRGPGAEALLNSLNLFFTTVKRELSLRKESGPCEKETYREKIKKSIDLESRPGISFFLQYPYHYDLWRIRNPKNPNHLEGLAGDENLLELPLD